jgi:hypothetical protein
MMMYTNKAILSTNGRIFQDEVGVEFIASSSGEFGPLRLKKLLPKARIVVIVTVMLEIRVHLASRQ